MTTPGTATFPIQYAVGGLALVLGMRRTTTGAQAPRGWGLFLIKNMVDDMRVSGDGTHHTVELFLNLKGDNG